MEEILYLPLIESWLCKALNRARAGARSGSRGQRRKEQGGVPARLTQASQPRNMELAHRVGKEFDGPGCHQCEGSLGS